jgi:hypothetical protein
MDASYGVGIDTFGVSRFAGAVTFSSSVYISSSIYVASGGLTVAAQSTFTAVVSFSTNPFLSVYNSVTQSPGGVTEVLELFDTVKSVQSIAFNTSDHNTVTINYAGVYSATCGLFVSGNTSNKIFLTLYDDSNPVAAARGYDNTTAGATITASQTLALAVGDVLQCKFQPGAAGQTFTGGQSFQYMTVVKVQ